jgi:signal transduction histidine kinase
MSYLQAAGGWIPVRLAPIQPAAAPNGGSGRNFLTGIAMIGRTTDTDVSFALRMESGGVDVIIEGAARMIKNFFTPPVFPEDEEKTRQARLLHGLLVGALLLLSFGGAAVIAFLFAEKILNSILIAIVFGILSASYWLMRTGRVQAASLLFLSGLLTVFAVFTAFSGGMLSVVAAYFVALVVIAGLLLGFRGALVFSVICCLFGFGLVLLGAGGYSPPRIFTVEAVVGWLDLTIVLFMTTLVMHFAARDLDAALESTRRRLEERRWAEASTLRQMERLRALHTIERAITGSMDLQTVLNLLVKEVVGQLHMDATSVLLLEESERTLHFAAGEGFQTEALRYTRLKIGDGLAGQAAEKKTIVYFPDLRALRGNPILAESIAGEGFRVYYGVPLIAKGRFCGVMEIFQRSAGGPDPDWMPFLETLAGQAAIAIDNARLLEITKTQLKETEALYRINQGLAASIDPRQLMQDVVTLLQKNFGYFYVQIYIREKESGDFVLRAGSGEIGKKLVDGGHRLAAGVGIVGNTADTGVPFFTNDVDEVAFFKRNPLLPDTKSELAVPIKIDGQFLGLLDIQQVRPFLLTGRDVQMVSAVADQLAVALQKAQLYADLQSSLQQEKEMHSQLIHSEKLAVTGRLMASVSHELNNPLQAIQNALFLLNNERTISAQGKRDLAIVLKETDRMAAMLDRLRTTYKAVRKEDFRPVRVNEILEDVHALVATHLRHAGISFEYHPDSALPPVSAVSDQLRQVILNLFMNAVDAMPRGGRLMVSTQMLAADKEILIRVADTGEGIDPAILPRLFETFISGKENGTGLGLAISSEIVTNHNGRIQAENRAEGGATFRVWLPAAVEAEP